MYKCENCGTEFESAFCPNCGTAAEEPVTEEQVQKEIEKSGIDAAWVRYCPYEYKKYKIVMQANKIMNWIQILLIGICFTLLAVGVGPNVASYFFCAALISITIEAPVNMIIGNIETNKIKFILSTNIDMKILVRKCFSDFADVESSLKLAKEKLKLAYDKSLEIVMAYYAVKAKEENKSPNSGNYKHVLSFIGNFVVTICILIVGIILNSEGFAGKWWFFGILAILIIGFIIAMMVVKNMKINKLNKIKEWAEEYLSKN